MKTSNNLLLIKISEEFSKGNLEFAGAYLADDIKWNILGETPIIGKEQVLEVSKMVYKWATYVKPVFTMQEALARYRQGDWSDNNWREFLTWHSQQNEETITIDKNDLLNRSRD